MSELMDTGAEYDTTATYRGFHAAYRTGAHHWEVQRLSDPDLTIVRIECEPLNGSDGLLSALLEYMETQPAEPAAEPAPMPKWYKPGRGAFIGTDGTISNRRRRR